MDREPKIESRPLQPYVGKRTVMPMSEFQQIIPVLMDEVSKLLDTNQVAPTGNSFIRYHVIDMPDRIDVEVAFPVDQRSDKSASEPPSTLPAGRYAILTFTDVKNGIPANARLVQWIADQGEAMDSHETSDGDAFAGRIETLMTDPQKEPDQSKWQTQVAIKLL
jgi:effector-binding domain-containing protein